MSILLSAKVLPNTINICGPNVTDVTYNSFIVKKIQLTNKVLRKLSEPC